MSWRSKRGEDKAEQTLAAATVARVTFDEGSRAAGEEAIRGALARAELERPIRALVVVALDDEPLAEQLAAALRDEREVSVVRLDAVQAGEADAAFAVVPASMPAQGVVDALRPLDSILLGVVLADDASAPAPPQPPVSTFDAELEQHVASSPDLEASEERAEGADTARREALEALAELERAAGSSGTPFAAPSAPDPAPTAVAPPAPDAVAQKLAELTHREAALRRITAAVEEQRTRLEERERMLEREAAPPAPAVDDRLREELEEAVRRAERAEQRERELEGRVAELASRLESVLAQAAPAALVANGEAEPTAPVVPPASERPPDDGTYTVWRVEELVRDAELRGDPRAEEWAYYLPLLRQHADADGRLPVQFDTLVESVFGI
jgi:hypothetical protein